MTAPTPTIPTFTDGTVPTQVEMNALAANIDNLYDFVQGGFRRQVPSCIVRQTTQQTIIRNGQPGGGDTLVLFQQSLVDTDNMFQEDVEDRITIQTAGIYWLFGQIRWPPLATANVGFNDQQSGSILVNGTSFTNAIATNLAVGTENDGTAQASFGPGLPCGALANLAAGAAVYLNAWQNTATDLTLRTGGGSSYLGAFLLSPST